LRTRLTQEKQQASVYQMYESLLTVNQTWAQEIVQKIEPNIDSLALVANQYKNLRNLVASLDP
jgi:hypothetical protein